MRYTEGDCIVACTELEASGWSELGLGLGLGWVGRWKMHGTASGFGALGLV